MKNRKPRFFLGIKSRSIVQPGEEAGSSFALDGVNRPPRKGVTSNPLVRILLSERGTEFGKGALDRWNGQGNRVGSLTRGGDTLTSCQEAEHLLENERGT